MVAAGPRSAREVVRGFDFTLKPLLKMASRRNPKDKGDIRSSFIRLLVSMLTSGDETVSRHVFEVKGMLESIFKAIDVDRPEIQLLVGLPPLPVFCGMQNPQKRSDFVCLREGCLVCSFSLIIVIHR